MTTPSSLYISGIGGLLSGPEGSRSELMSPLSERMMIHP